MMGDVHAGAPHVGVDRLRAVVAEVNGTSPDVVVLLGDYVIHGVVGGRFVEPEITAEIVAGLRAPGGVVAVLGNHDWWYDGFRVRRALEGRGIVVLENEVHPVIHSSMPETRSGSPASPICGLGARTSRGRWPPYRRERRCSFSPTVQTCSPTCPLASP